MRIDEFEIGDKVVPPAAVVRMDSSLYAVVRFIGSRIIVLETELGTEFTVYRDLDGFVLWRPEPTYDELKEEVDALRLLGDELVTSIRNAAWNCELTGPTHHMRSAVERWTEVCRV